MPLLWVSSGFMVFLLVFVFVDLYFTFIYSKLEFFNNELLNISYKMEW